MERLPKLRSLRHNVSTHFLQTICHP